MNQHAVPPLGGSNRLKAELHTDRFSSFPRYASSLLRLPLCVERKGETTRSSERREFTSLGNFKAFWPVLVLLILLLQGWVAFAHTAIYAFGDSLTDTGNRPSTPDSYYEGRFSNGPIWIEYLSSKLELVYVQDHNFARSLSTTAEALMQVERFVAPDNPGDSLYVVWAGGNDFLNALVFGLDDAAWRRSLTEAVNNLSNSVEILYLKGARTIVVPNAVDYGKVPGSALFPPFFNLFVGGQVDLFNSMLNSALEDIASQHSDLDLRTVDVHSILDAILSSPRAYGFTETAAGALLDPNLPDKTFQGPGKDYLFWDLIHPTSKLHAIIADGFFAALSPHVRLAAVSSPGKLTLSFQGLSIGAAYLLQQTVDFIEWKDLATIDAFSRNLDFLVDDEASTASFYRLRAVETGEAAP